MTKCLTLRVVSICMLLGPLVLLTTACGKQDAPASTSLAAKQAIFDSLKNNLSLPLEARAQKLPATLLLNIKEGDRSIGIAHADTYTARMPTDADLALIKSYLSMLPRVHQITFSRKLLGIFIIDGFSGAGMSDWVVDREGHTYYYLILNSALFDQSIDDWLSYKDDSTFDHETSSLSLRVRTHTAYKALMYGLLHEGAHIVDYELGITPYLDAEHRQLSGRTGESSAFTDGVWRERLQPVAQYDFNHRNALNTYGIFSNRALLPRMELPALFAHLSKTPFASFYSATSWNEDLADYVTYHHLQYKLGGSITLELHDKEKVVGRYRPVESALAKQREKSILVFAD